jgi:hypothetical protein
VRDPIFVANGLWVPSPSSGISKFADPARVPNSIAQGWSCDIQPICQQIACSGDEGSSLGGEMGMKCMVHNDQKIKQLKDFRRRRSKEEIVTELLKEDLSEDVT